MKVCDLALFSPTASSGVKTYISSKIAYVSRRPNLDHVVIVPGPRDEERTELRSRILQVRGVPTPYPDVRVTLELARVARMIEREAPDVIELNCQYSLPWAAFLATRKSRTPIVGVYHTDVGACVEHWAHGAGTFVSSSIGRLVDWYEGLIYRHCTLTIVLNPAMRERVLALGAPNVAVLPCGVDTATFHPSRRDPAFRRSLGIEPGQTVVIYAGRLSPEKELDVLWRAHAELAEKNVVLLIAGGGPDAADIARRAKGDPRVRYLGDISSRADLARAYASADVFVIPGRYETFGMATLEALSCGVPVVGIRESGTAAVVPQNLGILTAAGSASELAAAVLLAATWASPALRDACHAFADTYSWDRVFDRYFAHYRALIGGDMLTAASG